MPPETARPVAFRRPAAGYAYVLAFGLALAGATVTSFARFAAPPLPGRPAGILFAPFTDPRADLESLLTADPGVAILRVAYGGRLVYAVSNAADPARRFRMAGAIHAFDALAAGCASSTAGARR